MVGLSKVESIPVVVEHVEIPAPYIGADGTGAFAIPLPQGVRLLVVDDDAGTRRALHRALTRVGFEVTTADDVAAAVQAAEAAPPDVAIVDLGLPGCGLTLVRELRERYGAGVHITMLSGRDEDEAQAAAFAAGVDDYLRKPISARDLERRMSAAARKRQAFVDARHAREHADQLRAYSAEAAALLAHDLNNGLAVGLSNATFLSEVLALGEDERQALDATVRSLRRMAGLVANFVDISRFEDGVVRANASRVAVRQLLDEVLAMHVPQASSGIRLTIDCDAALAGTFDAALIERVLHNLVGNAMRYCGKGGAVTVAARALDVADRAAGVELTISNTGPQVPAEVAANLFSKYGRGGNGKRGLGLYFCRLACEAHGGTIAQQPGVDGPSFRIQLPGPHVV